MNMNKIENSTTERIIRTTGREPVSCKCALCKSQCRRTPCLGTPQDIWALIEAGYGDRLALTAWGVGMMVGKLPFPVPMVQIVQTPDGCAFFKDGLCQLHDLGLKPTEGRLSHHSVTAENFDFNRSLSWNVAREWLNEKNARIIIRIFERFSVITVRVKIK